MIIFTFFSFFVQCNIKIVKRLIFYYIPFKMLTEQDTTHTTIRFIDMKRNISIQYVSTSNNVVFIRWNDNFAA